MEHSRKQKLLMIVALVIGIASLSVGFAAFSTTLSISSSASVTPSSDTFSVKFSTEDNSLVVGDVTPSSWHEGASGSAGIINNTANPTITNLSATFTEPGQYVHYKFYARNEGEYSAYLNSVNFIGKKICMSEEMSSSVQSACDSIRLLVVMDDDEYSDTTEVSGHELPSKSRGDEIIIIIDYLTDGAWADEPFTVTLPDIAFVYSTVDDPSIKPTVLTKLVSGNLNDPGSIVSIGEEQFYVFGQEDGNVKLLSMYNLHVGNMVSVDENGNKIVTALTNPTGVQDVDAVASKWDDEGNPVGYPWIGTVAFSSDSQKGVNESDYSGSIVEGYVNNYASYLRGLGVNVAEARLITTDELVALGCDTFNVTCSGAPDFIYKTSYWGGTAVNARYVRGVFSDALFGGIDFYCTNESEIGVRPVIEIPLSEFE